VLVTGALTSVALVAGPGHAAPDDGIGGEATPEGYAAVAVDLRGDYDPAKQGSQPRPRPLCWWEEWSETGDASDPEAVKKWYEDVYLAAGDDSGLRGEGSSVLTSGNVGGPGVFADAVAASLDKVKYPNGVTWYRLEWNRDLISGDDWDWQLAEAGCDVERFSYGGMGTVPVTYRWFPTGAPPEPTVDPRSLADYAYRVMDLAGPTLEWNPKIGARQDAALVNLPTWLWADDDTTLVGKDGTPGSKRVVATAGGVQVTVTAETDAVDISSPAGRRSCTVDEVRTTYRSGTDEGGACTLAFNRGSYAYRNGFPVDTSVRWTASWTSNTGDEDTLPSRTVGETTSIRVAQSQALVTAVD